MPSLRPAVPPRKMSWKPRPAIRQISRPVFCPWCLGRQLSDPGRCSLLIRCNNGTLLIRCSNGQAGPMTG